MEKLELTLQNLKDHGLKCNIKKSLFGQTDIEYLGFWVTCNGIRTVNKKVEAKVNMTPLKTQKHVRVFIVLLNYYRDMWAKRSHLLHPLISLTSNKVKFKWADVEQKAFDEFKV